MRPDNQMGVPSRAGEVRAHWPWVTTFGASRDPTQPNPPMGEGSKKGLLCPSAPRGAIFPKPYLGQTAFTDYRHGVCQMPSMPTPLPRCALLAPALPPSPCAPLKRGVQIRWNVALNRVIFWWCLSIIDFGTLQMSTSLGVDTFNVVMQAHALQVDVS